MHISRVVIKNFRSFAHLDVRIKTGIACVIGENNSGKTNLLHAIRLCLDAGLSSTYRSLTPNDIHSALDIRSPNQVLIGLEITDFQGKTNEEALVGAWQHRPGLARLIYRYRPKLSVREDLDARDREPGDLTRDDYSWEIVAGGNPSDDLTDIEWDQDVGSSIRFSDLQAFLVIFLPALRDVESDLRHFRNSPLARLIDVMKIPPNEQEELLDVLRQANQEIARAATIEEIARAIDSSFKKITEPAFSMDVRLGLAEPSFQAIVRALRILLTNMAMEDFEPSSNGLGLNNILYVAILIEYFRKRFAQKKSAGQIILFEEPEAHLHPQLQLTLFKTLSELPFQSILTTHSTHITANAPLKSYIVLSQTSHPAVISTIPVEDADLEQSEINDLERYLDATRSSLLFARKVMLVEGPAELFLIPALFKNVEHVDLDREGISIIPIYGVHFDVYAKLFATGALPKRCAIITDGDQQPSDADPNIGGEDDCPAPPDLEAFENERVRVFACKTTFEFELVAEGTLEMFARTADDIGAPRVAKRLRGEAERLKDKKLNKNTEILMPLREIVLKTAKRFGKARFAQIAARHADEAKSVPKYIAEAVSWLRKG